MLNKPISKKEAAAQFLGCDYDELKDYEYEAGDHPIKVYEEDGELYTFTKGKKSTPLTPYEKYEINHDWEQWLEVPHDWLNKNGVKVWKHVYND